MPMPSSLDALSPPASLLPPSRLSALLTGANQMRIFMFWVASVECKVFLIFFFFWFVESVEVRCEGGLD